MKKKLVLVGGGHAHVQVIKLLADQLRLSDLTECILLSEASTAYYSGMFPACVAGLYTEEQIRIRVDALSLWAGIQFICGRVQHIDPRSQVLYYSRTTTTGENIDGGKPAIRSLHYDFLSLNVGSSTREVDIVPGVAEFALPTRPISTLLGRIQRFEAEFGLGEPLAEEREISVVVVGGGAAGVELIWALHARFSHHRRLRTSFALVTESLPLVQERGARTSSRVHKVMDEKGVLVAQGKAIRVTDGRLYLEDGSSHPFHLLLWATGAAPPPLLRHLIPRGMFSREMREEVVDGAALVVKTECDAHDDSIGDLKTENEADEEEGIALDRHGFLRVHPTLQSISHPNVFGRTLVQMAVSCRDFLSKRPSAEITALHSEGSRLFTSYSVREGPVLAENLLRAIREEPLQPYRPQSGFLALLMTGDERAVLSWKGFGYTGGWAWTLKDKIDRSFMDQFNVELLPPRTGDGA